MNARKSKIKKGFYYRGFGNHAALVDTVYHWDGTTLLVLEIIEGKEYWLDCSAHWGKDFKRGSVWIGDIGSFTYLGE